MLRKFAIEQARRIRDIIVRFFIVSLSLWLCAYALPEVIDSPLVSDKLIESVYYGGKKINKITYDDLKNKNVTDQINTDINLIQNYYTNYLNQVVQAESDEEADFLFEDDKKKIFKVKEEGNKSEIKSVYKSLSETEEKLRFSKNLYALYGNRTIFNMDLRDLENIVHTAIMTDGQAVIFWETLLQMKTDRAKIISGKIQNEIDMEYYLFNILALKTTGLIIITLFIFIISHKIQIHAIKNFFIYNLISTIMTFYILDNLYIWKYYIASSIMFVQLGLCVKYLCDSFVSNFGYNLEDYDIFASITKTKTVTQFVLKVTISMITTFLLGFLSIFKYRYILNTTLSYFCLVHLLYLISFFLQYEVPVIFQPFKHFLLMSVGLLNFLLTNFHRKIARFSHNSLAKDQNDSFYIVSETFSFVCISYLYEYLFTQANQIAHFFYERDSDNEEYTKKISSLAQSYKEHQKSFVFSEDCLWFVVFSISACTSLVGIAKTRYLTFLFSLQYFKIILKVFGSLFKVKLLRCVVGWVLFFLILGNHIVTSKNDAALFDALYITNLTTIAFLKFVARLAGLVFITLMIIGNFEYIVIMNDKRTDFDDGEDSSEQILRKVEVSTTYEKKKKKKVKTIEIQIVKEDRTPFNYMNIFYINSDLCANYATICLIFFLIKDVEKNYFIIVFYSILAGILIIRTLFLVNEFRNSIEFLYAYMFAFLLGIRLLTITKLYNALYFAVGLYMFVMVIFYCMTDRKNLIVTLLLFVHLYSACVYLVSNHLLILMISLTCLPISMKFDDNKYGCSVIRFFLPGLIIMFLQLYGFKNIFSNMLLVNSYLQNFFKFDMIGYIQRVVQGNFINEFGVIEYIFNNAVSFFEGKPLQGIHLF